MDNLKALKKQLKEDIITYDCIDYVDEDGKIIEYVELLVNRIIELGLYK